MYTQKGKDYVMNKSQVIDAVAQKTGPKKKEAENVVNAFLSTIEDALANEEKVQLVGFGTFETKVRKARIGRNPATKESIEIPASKHPSFTAGKALKEIVNK